MDTVKKGDKALLTLEEALLINRQKMRAYYQDYVNPSLVAVMKLIDFDKEFVKAEGEYVWDADGKRYLDFLGGYGALNLGHNPREVLAAIEKVATRPNIMQAALNPLASALAHNLALVAPGDLQRVFFCNSGTEAVEGALKLGRAANPNRSKIVYCENSFHGKSFGSLSVTGREKYRQPFKPLLPGCEAVPFGDLKALEAKLSFQDVAAFIVEPIQGEGGVNVPPEGYLTGVRELCDRYGTILIVDEIQTGLGRTGKLFACEHDGIIPDIICLAKSLGGGVMPLGAYIARPQLWDNVYGGMDKYALHTSTFGGNTIAMAVGIAALQSILANDLPRQAEEKGNYLLGKMKELQATYDLIQDVRGKGLLIGVEFKQPVGKVMNGITGGRVGALAEEYFGALFAGELMNKHQIITAYTLNNPNVIRLEPPLTVSEDSLETLVYAMEDIFKKSGFTKIILGSAGKALRSLFKKSNA